MATNYVIRASNRASRSRIALWGSKRTSTFTAGNFSASRVPQTLFNPIFHPFASFSSSSNSKSSPFASNSSSSSQPSRKRPRKKLKFVPQKAAVALTPKARNFFKALLESNSDEEVIGILLNYHQSSTGEPRMVFSFDFCKQNQLSELDEGVSLEVLDDGVTPKPPEESEGDGLPKLYVHHNAFMKVLGCTLDIDEVNFVPLLYDREGNKLDPNA